MIFRGLAPEPFGKVAVVLRQASVWTWLGVLASIAIVAVTTVAVVDHTQKTHDMNRASVAQWYCGHQGKRCDERKTIDIEDDWNARERVYKAADVGLLVIAAGAVIAARRRRE